jgi:mono/diheme cytochrome c family protein
MEQGMRTGIATFAALFCLALAGTLVSQEQEPASGTAAPSNPGTLPPSPLRGFHLRAARDGGQAGEASAPSNPQRALIDQYCAGCHSDRLKSGGLALSALNLDDVGQSAEVAEKVIRKLRGGLMPPGGARRPDGRAVIEFVSWLEN